MAEEHDDHFERTGDDDFYTQFDDAVTRTVAAKAGMRNQLEEDIQRFLAQGGRVMEVDASVTADPPKKPVSNYGSRPI